jgi:dienelactone hydrolase
MLDRFAKLPASLRDHARTVMLPVGGVPTIPALMCHPDWLTPAPTMLWMHGRTANKELDSGRYIRWLKHGIAAVAIDIPSHGERAPKPGQPAVPKSTPRSAPGADSLGAPATLAILSELISEIDHVVESLADPVWQNVFDLDRLGIGGMSLGGMAALRRLCDPHDFTCAAVECTTGDLWSLYREDGPRPWGQTFPEPLIAPMDALRHLETFRPIPLLALHCEADRIIPWPIQQRFLDRLRDHYVAKRADPTLVRVRTWPSTGAPEEHSGFGRHGNEAKNEQTNFLSSVLK